MSFNIVYRFNYFFRRSSIDYTNLFNSYTGHKDYALRWQKPGDENFTSVPSLAPSVNASRDDFYAKSEILVERGDHIRLQDIRISYSLDRKIWNGMPLQDMQFYIYMNNIGLLWKANKYGIDPDYSSFTSIPPSRSIALGLTMNF